MLEHVEEFERPEDSCFPAEGTRGWDGGGRQRLGPIALGFGHGEARQAGGQLLAGQEAVQIRFVCSVEHAGLLCDGVPGIKLRETHRFPLLPLSGACPLFGSALCCAGLGLLCGFCPSVCCGGSFCEAGSSCKANQHFRAQADGVAQMGGHALGMPAQGCSMEACEVHCKIFCQLFAFCLVLPESLVPNMRSLLDAEEASFARRKFWPLCFGRIPGEGQATPRQVEAWLKSETTRELGQRNLQT